MPLLPLFPFVAHWRVNFTFTFETGICLHGGSVGRPGVGLSTGGPGGGASLSLSLSLFLSLSLSVGAL